MGVSGTAVLAISTPDAHDDNYYNDLMDLEDPITKQPLFKTIRIGLACDDCVAKGETNKCTHKQDLIPPWKSTTRQTRMQEILRSSVNTFNRENMGMVATDSQFMFPAYFVRALHKAPLFHISYNPDLLFLAIDPSGGGSQSDYAMATIAFCRGQYILVSIDHCSIADITVVNEMIVEHVVRLRKIHVFSRSHIFVYTEANMSWVEADRVARLLINPNLQPIAIQSHDPQKKGRPGVITDESTKFGYVSLLRSLLQDTNILYAQQYTSADPNETKTAFEEQLRQFKRAIRPPADPEHNKFKVSYTGKGFAKKDDLAMAVMMACYWCAITRANSDFQTLCEARGWVL